MVGSLPAVPAEAACASAWYLDTASSSGQGASLCTCIVCQPPRKQAVSWLHAHLAAPANCMAHAALRPAGEQAGRDAHLRRRLPRQNHAAESDRGGRVQQSKGKLRAQLGKAVAPGCAAIARRQRLSTSSGRVVHCKQAHRYISALIQRLFTSTPLSRFRAMGGS